MIFRVFVGVGLFLIALLGADRLIVEQYRPEADARAVVLYSAVWCGYCDAVRTQLQNTGVQFEERDVEKSWSGMLGLLAYRARGVPVTVVGPEVIHGYQPAAISKALQQINLPQPVDEAS